MHQVYNLPRLKQRRRQLRWNQTDSEKLIWSQLRNKQLLGVKFFRQYSVGSYVLDFYSPKQRLGIEIDGGQHGDDAKREYDEYRTNYLAERRIKILRFWNNEVMSNINGVLEVILWELKV